MNHTFTHFLVLILASTTISCNNVNKTSTTDAIKIFSEIKNATWLIGKWQNNSPQGNATEVWEQKNDSTFVGKSCFVVGKDTVSSESLRLEQNGKELFYIPTVSNQNNQQPVKFVLTSSTPKQLIFENPKHDFPQKITYTQITNDSLMAEISGMLDGKQNVQNFPMSRVK